MSRGLKERAGSIRTARDRLQAELGREPTLSELAEETGLEPEEIAAAEEANAPVASLQMETGDGFTLESVLGTEGMEEGIVEREALRAAVSSLPDRERQVIVLRYFRGLTQDRTARIMGVSQVQISRVEKKAMEYLRRSWRNRGRVPGQAVQSAQLQTHLEPGQKEPLPLHVGDGQAGIQNLQHPGAQCVRVLFSELGPEDFCLCCHGLVLRVAGECPAAQRPGCILHQFHSGGHNNHLAMFITYSNR